MATAVEPLKLKFELLSAATFGRGDGRPGLVDLEIEHDEFGLPYLRGRTLRGLLAEEMRGLLFALNLEKADKWKESLERLLGVEGKMTDEMGILHIGDARLPSRLRQFLIASVEPDETKRDDKKLAPEQMLESFAAIRRQTAMTERGAPEPASLRAMRVVRRGTMFEAELILDQSPQDHDLPLMAATVLAWKRAGTGRNRGRGRLRAWINDEAWTLQKFKLFQDKVTT